MAIKPKKGVCALPASFKNIKKEPENIPMMEPAKPINISKFLDKVVVLFMFNNMFLSLYIFTSRLLPLTLHYLSF